MTSDDARHNIQTHKPGAHMSELEQILASIKSAETTQASRQAWNPEHQAEIDIRIATDVDFNAIAW